MQKSVQPNFTDGSNVECNGGICKGFDLDLNDVESS